MTRIAQIEALQIELLANPKAMSFAQLADLYIAENMIEPAEKLLIQSLKFYPYSISGHMLLGRVYQTTDRLDESIQQFNFCIQKAPDNWMCVLLRAQSFLKLNQYKNALADFTKVTVLNPQNQMAHRAIAKIDSMDLVQQQDNDHFETRKLTSPAPLKMGKDSISLQKKLDPKLERVLSLVDALSARQEHKKALQILRECQSEFGQNDKNKTEIEMRLLKLSQFEVAEKLRPKQNDSQSTSRKYLIYEKKIDALNLLLRRIVELKNTQALV